MIGCDFQDALLGLELDCDLFRSWVVLEISKLPLGKSAVEQQHLGKLYFHPAMLGLELDGDLL